MSRLREWLLREIAEKYLVPFFSGSKLEDDSESSSSGQGMTAFRDPCSIAFKAAAQDKYRLVLTRSQPFATATDTIVPEISVVRAFVEIIASMADALESELKHDLLSTFQRRVVAKALSRVYGSEDTILSGIDQMSSWASRQYEGGAIAASIGFRHLTQPQTRPTLNEISKYDFSAVISNGYDTLLEFDFRVICPL